MKRCKGTTKKTKGLGCGIKLPYSERNGLKSYNAVYGLGKNCGCYSKWLLNSDEGKAAIKKATLKATATRRNFEKAEEEHKSSRSLPKELKLTQTVFNKWIRLRDRGKPCASSNIPWKSDFDAGHLFSVNKYNSLRFNEDNVHGQSIGDNRFKEGNFDDYIINIEKRIGKKRLDDLMNLAKESKKTDHKWTVHELKEIRAKYNLKIKDFLV